MHKLKAEFEKNEEKQNKFKGRVSQREARHADDKFDESGDPICAGGYRKEKRVGGDGRQTGVSEKQSSELFLDDDVAF